MSGAPIKLTLYDPETQEEKATYTVMFILVEAAQKGWPSLQYDRYRKSNR